MRGRTFFYSSLVVGVELNLLHQRFGAQRRLLRTPGGHQEGLKRPPGVAHGPQNFMKNLQKRFKNAFETLRIYA